jgi:hypothetical protein
MKLIEHDPNENRPQSNSVWWVLWPLIGLQWVGYLYFQPADWWGLALGLGTGAILATWAVEMTGNKVPSWMAGSSRRHRDL